MKYVPLFSCFFFLCTVLFSETSVWKAQRDDSVIYLGGTCHLLRESDFPLPPEFDQAYQESDILVFETDMSQLDNAETGQDVLKETSYPDGETIEQHLSPSVYSALEEYCQTNGIPLTRINRLKPAVLTGTLLSRELMQIGVTTRGVDRFYFEEAVSHGKPIRTLETVSQQADTISVIGENNEDRMILETLEEIKTVKTVYKQIISAWRAGNTEQIHRLLNARKEAEMPAMYKETIIDRNHRWMIKIETFMKTPETEFILVGAAHLAGPDGLLTQLKKEGFVIEQIGCDFF